MILSAPRPRRTLARSTQTIRGIGLHSGEPAALRILPAEPESGLAFTQRHGGGLIKASTSAISDTARCTKLGNGTASIQTVEHVLSALAGIGVDDALIEVEGPEVPAVDGSAEPFVALARQAGICDQDGDFLVMPRVLEKPEIASGENGSVVVAIPSRSFRASVVLHYPRHPFIGAQGFVFEGDSDEYETEVAAARTFGFLAELEALRSRGLAGGASYDNALVLGADSYENEPRFPNELARHKLLDLIGDLALVGRPLSAHVIAVKPSHALNTRLAHLCS